MSDDESCDETGCVPDSPVEDDHFDVGGDPAVLEGSEPAPGVPAPCDSWVARETSRLLQFVGALPGLPPLADFQEKTLLSWSRAARAVATVDSVVGAYEVAAVLRPVSFLLKSFLEELRDLHYSLIDFHCDDEECAHGSEEYYDAKDIGILKDPRWMYTQTLHRDAVKFFNHASFSMTEHIGKRAR